MSGDLTEPPRRDSTEPPPPSQSSSSGPFASSSSSDDLNASLVALTPDPMLEEYHTGEIALVDTGAEATPTSEPHGSYDPVTGQTDPASASRLLVDSETVKGPPLSSSDVMSTLNLSIPSTPTPKPPRKPDPDEEEDDDGDDEPPRRNRQSLATVFLMSYASAVTIALIWVLWTGRRAREGVEVDAPSAIESPADEGARADGSRKSTARPALAANHLMKLGETLRLGVIEVTPIAVSAGPVTLVRNFGAREKKSGGKGVLKLRLRLRNVSEDTVITPLEAAFLRHRPDDDPATIIETGQSEEPPIKMYPLALESELSILGQEFRELEPGGVFETMIVTAPGAASSTTPSMTWRIRLRTDTNRTDDLGVRFKSSDIRPR